MGVVSIVAGYGGVELATERWGAPDDPSIILVHGVGQSRGIWRQTAKDLVAAGRFVLTYDLRGHGESATPKDGAYTLSCFVGDLRAVMSTLQTRPVLVGASAGGWMAAIAIGEGEGHVASGIVMVDAAPWLDEAASQRISELLQPHAAGFESVEDAVEATAKLHPLRAAPDPKTLSSRLKRRDDGRLHWAWDPRVLHAIDIEEAAARLSECLPRIAIPTLSLRGAGNELMTSDASLKIQMLAPSAECADIPGAGHLVVSEQTEAFNALLLEFLERRVPRYPRFFQAGSEPRVLRDALGCFATGVTVVTARAPDGVLVGLTANSFTSVSLDPPLILVCIARSAGSVGAIEQAEHFAINVLHIGQQPASERFARRLEDRFAATPHELWENDVPVLSNALATFACRRYAIHDGGDHLIVVGLVERVQFEPRRDPLLYFRGKYRRLHFQ